MMGAVLISAISLQSRRQWIDFAAHATKNMPHDQITLTTRDGMQYRAELYQGAAHGWMMPDFPVFDAQAAERGWDAMLELFGRTLRTQGR
jgi:dienelactone hydrolase